MTLALNVGSSEASLPRLRVRCLTALAFSSSLPRLGLLGHVALSIELSMGAAATVTTDGVDRDHPFHVGETLVVKDRGALRGGQVRGPPALADQRVVS